MRKVPIAVVAIAVAIGAPAGSLLLGIAAAVLVAAMPTGACPESAGSVSALSATSSAQVGDRPSEPAADPSESISSPDQARACPLVERQLGADPGAVLAADGEASIAVTAALTAVGRGGSYVAEGNGPVDFDCSGLTAWAWRQAGVGLVDYSYTQWDQTQRISRAQLQPGDLVFWFGGAEHHVAIVTAFDGVDVWIAEAANRDADLRVRRLGGSWDDAYLTGFGRVRRP